DPAGRPLELQRDEALTRLEAHLVAVETLADEEGRPEDRVPANGSSARGVKIRMRASPPRSGGSRNTVSERFSSRAIRCICSSENGCPSGNTPSWLPSSGVSVKTSIT